MSVVLNVNDDAASRYVITRVLQHAGFEVVEAVNGTDAIAIAQGDPAPSLVVLDVHLPDINGLDVCRALRADPRTAALPILQTSATYVTDDSKVLGLESGADGYLVQPIDPSVLVATARALLRTSVAEREVRQAAVAWQRTFDGLVEPVLIIDRDGRSVRANRAMGELAAIAEGDAAAGRLCAAIGWDPAPLVEEAMRRGARAAADVEVASRRFHATVDPIPDESGAVVRALLVLQDVTDRWRLVEEERARAADLAEANRRKDQMLAMLAHELRNPLNAIATANTVQERLPAGDPQLPALRATIARHTRNLARLVDDLLEMSRITRGRVSLQPADLDLRTIVEHAAAAARPLVDSRGQRLNVALPSEPLPLRGDPLRLEQTIVNLLTNAAKFSDPGSDIALACDRAADGRSAELRVIDEGIGIDPSRLDAIFDLFVQEDETLARSRGGVGLGLTLARHLVELHGGTITASSKGIGCGAEFVIRLPLSNVIPEAPLPPPIAEPADATPMQVLVVEDSPDAAELLRTLLESWGHHVRVEYHGASGLDAAMAYRPDVALIDIGLPGIDGYQVAENLRGSTATRGIHLIAITGYGRPEDRARALAAGFDRFIVKPVNFDELSAALAAAAMDRA